jgi:hypothetical protein
MPEHVIREDIEKGALVQLDMPELKRGSERLSAIYRTDSRRAPLAPGSLPGSRLRRQRRPKPWIMLYSFRIARSVKKNSKRGMSGGAVHLVASSMRSPGRGK